MLLILILLAVAAVLTANLWRARQKLPKGKFQGIIIIFELL